MWECNREIVSFRVVRAIVRACACVSLSLSGWLLGSPRFSSGPGLFSLPSFSLPPVFFVFLWALDIGAANFHAILDWWQSFTGAEHFGQHPFHSCAFDLRILIVRPNPKAAGLPRCWE